MTPAYYLGRRVHVFHASSHPVTYVYMFVREQRPVWSNKFGRYLDGRKVRMRLARTDAYWRDHDRRNARSN